MMKIFSSAPEKFAGWIDAVASFVVGWLERLNTRPLIRLTEIDAGEFAVEADVPQSESPLIFQPIRLAGGGVEQDIPDPLAKTLSGSRVELILRPGHFSFRQIELPHRAGEFLEGIVRAQIDRLTPWHAADAAFGWSKPVETSAGRMTVTVAAGARALVKPYVEAIMSLGGQAVAVLTSPPASNGGSVPIKVLEERSRHGLEIRRVRQALVYTLGGAGILTAVSIALAGVGGAYFTAQHDDLSRQISRARTQAGARQAADSYSAASALLTLEQRKHNVPATVMILDALSRILPDHTYVTELRIEGEKLRVIGSTRDAPSLIGLIEQSGRFSRATFFAPTTRSPSDPGERFHIEAVIQPSAGSSS
jgi:general secretion pathway protein L